MTMMDLLTALSFSLLLVTWCSSLSLGAVSECPHHCSCTDEVPLRVLVECSVSSAAEWELTCIELTDYSLHSPRIDLKVIGNLTGLSLKLGCLPDLRSLDVSQTFISLDEYTFSGLQIETLLNLSSNRIGEFPVGSFAGLNFLTELDLSDNSIASLEPDIFSGLRSLLILHAGFNNLSSLSVEVFPFIPRLEHLDLKNNLIQELSALHLSSSTSIRRLNLHGNLLTALNLATSGTEFTIFQNLSSLDISGNALECSCLLGNLFNLMPNLREKLRNPSETICMSPESLKGRDMTTVNPSEMLCSAPSNIISYPSSSKNVPMTSSFTLECKADGFPKPSIMWITPWNDVFVNYSKLKLHNQESQISAEEKINTIRKYSEPNVFIESSVELLANDDLFISKFRGSLSGNFTCIAFNAAGNTSADISLTVYSSIKSVYTYSLILGGYCATGFLIFGFIVGFIKMVVVWLRQKLYFIVPLFSKAPSSTHTPEDAISNDFQDDTCNKKPDSDSSSSGTMPVDSSSPLLVHNKNLSGSQLPDILEIPDDAPSPGSWRPQSIFDSLEEARGRLRYGVGRKMERVRKNVQSIKESGSVYVHNIVETGSSAASRMKAGMALGVETVKYHVQSFKELCGTGDMGTQTISMVSVETDVDSSQQKEVIRQITYV